MKNKIAFLLSLAIVMVCLSPLTAFATNETSGSTDVIVEVPFVNTDSPPVYSYQVNIPASLTLKNGRNTFQITASKMDIPTDRELVVRINGAETFESDGSFYLFLNGDKNSEHWILCNIFRIQGYIESAVLGNSPAIAAFSPGALNPYNCDGIYIQHTIYNNGMDLEPGTYTGTIYYDIYLE